MNMYFGSCDFNNCYTEDVEDIWSTLKHHIYTAVSSYVPKVYIKPYSRPKWFTPFIQHQLNRVHTLQRKCRKKPSLSSSQSLATLESELQLAMNKAKPEYEQSLINQFAQNNSSKIYKYISNITGHSSIPSTI